MILENQNVLFFTRTMRLGGTENVVLQLCEIFKPLVNNIVVCSCGGVNVEQLSQMNIKHYEIPDIENKSPRTILKCMSSIMKIVKKEKITVIHTHHRMAAFYVAILRLYKKCVFINTSHNTFYNKKKLTQFAYKNCNVVACGEMVKANLIAEYGLLDKQIEVIHNAVKPFDNKIIEDNLIKKLHQENKFVIGNIGRLSEQKGMEYFIKAIPNVIERHPDARFVIIGSGEDENKLHELAREKRVKEYLYFLGYRNDVQNLICQMDFLVLSSLWEGLPLTPIEAYSVGKTIVATAVDGTVEIVRDEVDGLLVESRNENEIANKINWLIENPEEKKKYEIRARERFEEKFSFERLSQAYVSYYERLN